MTKWFQIALCLAFVVTCSCGSENSNSPIDTESINGPWREREIKTRNGATIVLRIGATAYSPGSPIDVYLDFPENLDQSIIFLGIALSLATSKGEVIRKSQHQNHPGNKTNKYAIPDVLHSSMYHGAPEANRPLPEGSYNFSVEVQYSEGNASETSIATYKLEVRYVTD